MSQLIMIEIAILITSFNRKDNTLDCLKSIYSQKSGIYNTSIFLVIDGSTDGTLQAVSEQYPNVNIIQGNGSLFWAGGMRLCYSIASKSKKIDHYLLINDDTVLFEDSFNYLLKDYSQLKINSILIGSTQGNNPIIENLTYGGRILVNSYNSKSKIVLPNNQNPQLCHLGNANIMLIPSAVIDFIGFLSDKFVHAIADYDFTLRAKKNGINSYISSKYLGVCHINDNQVKQWENGKKSSLKERVEYLYSVKGLSYNEYMFYIKKYFPLYVPKAWFLLWIKTIFPFLWDKLKKRK